MEQRNALRSVLPAVFDDEVSGLRSHDRRLAMCRSWRVGGDAACPTRPVEGCQEGLPLLVVENEAILVGERLLCLFTGTAHDELGDVEADRGQRL